MTEQRPTYEAGKKPRQLLGLYALFSRDVTPLEAHALFLERYGYAPAETRLTGDGGTLAGPIREPEPPRA